MSKKFKFEIVDKRPFVFLSTDDLKVEKVQVIDCDFNKYCKIIRANGDIDSTKWCYLFKSQADTEEYNDSVKRIEGSSVNCINVYKMLLSNKNYALWKKANVKEDREKPCFTVTIGSETPYDAKIRVKTLKKALYHFAYNYFNNPEGNSVSLHSQKDGCLLCTSDDILQLSTFESRPRKATRHTIGIKSRHTFKNNGLRELRKPSQYNNKRSW